MTPLSSDHHLRTTFLIAEREGKGVSSPHKTVSPTRTGQKNLVPPSRVLEFEQNNGILIYQTKGFFYPGFAKRDGRK